MKSILLIHGFLTDKNDFKPILEDLKKRYDYVCLFDLPGHSINDDYKLFTADNTINDVINKFDELKDNYGIVDVMGYSMGGALAIYLANNREVNKLILLSPANKYINPKVPISRISFYARYVIEKNKNRKLKKAELDLLEKNNNVMLDDLKSMDIAFNRLIPNYNYHTLSNFVKIINRCNKGLKEIKNPVLILWGKLDQLVPKSSIKYIYNLCTNKTKKMVIFDDICHLMLLSTNPKPLIDEIINFIDEEN